MGANNFILINQAKVQDMSDFNSLLNDFYADDEIASLKKQTQAENSTQHEKDVAAIKLAQELLILFNAIDKYTSQNHKQAGIQCIAAAKSLCPVSRFSSISNMELMIPANLVLSKITLAELDLSAKYPDLKNDVDSQYKLIEDYFIQSCNAAIQIINRSSDIDEINNAYNQLNEFPLERLKSPVRDYISIKNNNLKQINTSYVQKQIKLLKDKRLALDLNPKPEEFLELINAYTKIYNNIKGYIDDNAEKQIKKLLADKESLQLMYIDNNLPSKENNENLLKVCEDLKQIKNKEYLETIFKALFKEIDVCLDQLKDPELDDSIKLSLHNKLASAYTELSNQSELNSFLKLVPEYKNRPDLRFSAQVKSHTKMAQAYQDKAAPSTLHMYQKNTTENMPGSKLKTLSDPISQLRETIEKHNIYGDQPKKDKAIQHMFLILDKQERQPQERLDTLKDYLNSNDENIQAFKETKKINFTWTGISKQQSSDKYLEISGALEKASSALARSDKQRKPD